MKTTETKTDLLAQTKEKKAVVKATTNAKLILAPRITEKASRQSNDNAYTFVVTKGATKHALMDEIKKEYKVTPTAINIINLPRRKVFVRGKIGVQSGIKKAVVFLKKGDTIKLA